MASGASLLTEYAFSSLKSPTQIEDLRPFVLNTEAVASPVARFNTSQVSEISKRPSGSEKHMFVTCVGENDSNHVALRTEGSLEPYNSFNNPNDNRLVKGINLNSWALPPVMPNVVDPHTLSTFCEIKDHSKPSPIAAGNYRRHAFYARHHPQPSNVACLTTASDVKNKTRFSATGASGIASVVRDSKMSISSSPPSPRAGSLGGSYCRPALNCQNQCEPVTMAAVSALSCTNTTVAYTPIKKDFAVSTSSTFSSMSSRSSTSSLTGNSSRKRRADEELHRCSGYSSTNEVAAAVSHVDLHDRLSTGSVSPTEQVTGQSCKRSKNDNTEDDDVIFVSHEPGPGAKIPTELSNPFLSPSNIHPAKSSYKGRRKKLNRVIQPDYTHSTFVNSSSSLQTNEAVFEQRNFVSVPPVITDPSSFCLKPLASSSSISSKGYFLRSSVNRVVPQNSEIQARVVTEKPSESNVATNANNFHSASRCLTRSQRKRKEESSSVAATSSAANGEATREEKQNVLKPTFIPKPLVSTRRSLPSFKANYDIKGQIGVGGGGIVFAGTRKSDLAEVAIKRVPKEKVRRWGTLDGRSVPLEFELLQRAIRGGNDGVIRMYDWFERSKYFILVMERPQPVIDLFDYLSNYGAMKEDLAKKVFRQIVKAVHNFHANGVVHRDIKDENILLNLHSHEVKVIDFGCGTYLKDDVYSEFAGTPEFYPPEWFEERKYYGKRVDAWSIGVLLYTMLESEVPFPKEADIVKCQWKFNRTEEVLSLSCRNLIESMLQKDQYKRPSLEEILQHPWLQDDLPDISRSFEKESDNQPNVINLSASCKSSVSEPSSTTSVIYVSSEDTVSNTSTSTVLFSPKSPAKSFISDTSIPTQCIPLPITSASNPSNDPSLNGFTGFSSLTPQCSNNILCDRSSQPMLFAGQSHLNYPSPSGKCVPLPSPYSKSCNCNNSSVSSKLCRGLTPCESNLHQANLADNSHLAPDSPVMYSQNLQVDSRAHLSPMQPRFIQSPPQYQYVSSACPAPSVSQCEYISSMSRSPTFAQNGKQYNLSCSECSAASFPSNYWFLHSSLLHPYNNITPPRFCGYQFPAAPNLCQEPHAAAVFQGSRNISQSFPLIS